MALSIYWCSFIIILILQEKCSGLCELLSTNRNTIRWNADCFHCALSTVNTMGGEIWNNNAYCVVVECPSSVLSKLLSELWIHIHVELSYKCHLSLCIVILINSLNDPIQTLHGILVNNSLPWYIAKATGGKSELTARGWTLIHSWHLSFNFLNKRTVGRLGGLKGKSQCLILLMEYILNVLANLPVERKRGHGPDWMTELET